jgi:glycosyltransferase 2 family protein
MADEPRLPSPEGDAELTTFESFKPTLKHGVWVLIAVLVVVFIGLGVLSQVHKLPNYHWHFSPGWLVLSVLAFIVFQAMHMELWRRILLSLHGEISAPRAWSIWAVSLLARYVPTQLLMVISRVALTERQGVPRRICLASISYEFFLAVASAIGLSIAFVIGLPELHNQPERWLLLLVPVAMVIAVHPRVFGRVAQIILRRFGSEPLPELLPFHRVLLFGAGYFISFVIAGFGTYAFARSLHSIAASHLPLMLTSYAVGYSGAVLAFFIPGGLGVRDGATAAVLDTALPVSPAVAAAIGVRLVQTALELSFAAVAEVAARRFEAGEAEALRPEAASARRRTG